MKIKGLRLVNIQSHPNTEIHFHPNLTVIRGLSDAGKSVIIRGLKFVITNRASKRIQRKRTGFCESIIWDKGLTIGRYRDEKTNRYILKDKEHNTKEFKALGKDIPFDVIQALNLKDINIQEQRDTFFLIDESPGQVAKELNKVSGLSDIDATMKRINSEITSITSDIRNTNKSITSVKEEIEESLWSVQADKDLEEIEELSDSLDNVNAEFTSINSLVESYKHYHNQIKNLLPESIIEDYDDIFTLYENIQIDNDTIRDITTLVNSHNRLRSDLENIEVIDTIELQAIFHDITAIDTEMLELEELNKSFAHYQSQLRTVEESIERMSKEVSKFELCPTCKRPL